MTKTLYLDCASGLAGDMLVAALLDAGGDRENLDRQLSSLDLGEVNWELSEVHKKGFAAQHFQVTYPPQHAHRHLHHIHEILDRASLAENADRLARQLFLTLGQAEAQVHGTDLKKVHFHEVGAIDSIIDIVGIAVLLDQLDIQRVLCSDVCVGFGEIEIAHGKVQVPAPATALLLTGYPVYSGQEPGEMVTPTGAAFLSAFATPASGLPSMNLLATGVGAGTRDLETRANVLRVYLGESEAGNDDRAIGTEFLDEVQCQLDDMTGQQLGWLQSRLLEMGVRDCFLTNVQMKKGRPGVLLTVHVDPNSTVSIEEFLLQSSSTIGVRRHRIRRSVLQREAWELSSPWGPLQAKRVRRPDDTSTVTVEFDEVCRIAQQEGLDILEVQRRLQDWTAD